METKTERLTLKLLTTDKEALQRIATSEGEAMAVVIRKLIRKAARQLDTAATSNNNAAAKT